MTTELVFSMANAAVQPVSQEIPDKLYFRIGDVSKLAGVPPYVLRYWETEFPSLGPKKSGTGHRLYRRKDVELVLVIKQLLYEKRYTIEGARNYLAQPGVGKRAKVAAVATPAPAPASMQSSLFGPPPGVVDDLRRELQDLLSLLA